MNKAAFLDRDGVINQKAPVDVGYMTLFATTFFTDPINQ